MYSLRTIKLFTSWNKIKTKFLNYCERKNDIVKSSAIVMPKDLEKLDQEECPYLISFMLQNTTTPSIWLLLSSARN